MITDVCGKTFRVGQRVARAAKLFKVDGLHIVITEVTKVTDDKLYLDHSTRPVKFPERLAIIA